MVNLGAMGCDATCERCRGCASQDNVEVRRGGSAAAGAGPQVFGDAQVHRRGAGHEDGVSETRHD